MLIQLLAADEAHMQEVFAPAWLPAITSIIVFLAAFGFLYAKVWPLINKGLEEREKKIRDEIKSAEEARSQAKSMLAEYERNLAQAREEANQMIAKARNDAKALAEDLRSRNEAELSEMKRRAMQEIQSAKSNAINELYAEATSVATSIAAKILERELRAEDQQRLVDESLQELTMVRSN